MYFLDPDGGNQSNAFQAYRDMTSYGVVGPCVTLLMTKPNREPKSRTTLSFLMELTDTGKTATTSQ